MFPLTAQTVRCAAMRAARRLATGCVALAVVASLGCGEDHPIPTETWTPDDHVQPPQNVMDPRRTPEPTPDQRQPAEVRRNAARALFQMTCASCHGADGRGPAEAVEGRAAVRDLTTWEYHSNVSNQQIAEAIVRGREGMPAFGGQLAPQAIVALVEHVRMLGAPAAREHGVDPGHPDAEPGDGDADGEGAPEPTEMTSPMTAAPMTAAPMTAAPMTATPTLMGGVD